MAENVVSFVLNHLAQLAVREANLLYGVEDRVQSLQYELQMIKDLLNTTKRKKGMEYTVLNQIRDLAYIAEDVIDTFVAKVAIYKRRTILGKMLHGFDQTRLLHDIGHKIDKLKTTLNEIRENRDKYDAFREAIDQSAAEDEKEEEKRLQSLHEIRKNVEEEHVVGFVRDSKDVVKRLLEGDSNRKVVSIVGMGGLGKTTLARKVYNCDDVKKHFHCHAWVYVSIECRVKELLLDLLKHLMPNSEEQHRDNKKGKKSVEDIKSLSEEELKKKVLECLERKRYLVVVDDLWKCQDWDAVQDAFPDNNNGSRILITSRLKEVALHAGDGDPQYLRFLSEEDSRKLFCGKVFKSENFPFDLETLGKQMVQSCRGLPLSIIVLAGMLAKKEKSRKEWSKVVGHVNWYLTRDETQVKDIVLELSYDNLPRRLKPCFLYLGLFPEDFEIPVTQLLQIWVAEGFIQDTGNRDPDDVAEDYLYELIDRSLVQVAKVKLNGGLATCQVHDLLRDLCISKSKEDKVFEVCTKDNILIPTKPRRLSIHSDMDHYISLSNNDHSCIRSLFFFGQRYNVRGRERKWLLDNFKLVRVLEFGPNGCKEAVPSNIGNFIHLRYLRINSSHSTSIPNSILNLWNLETLDLDAWRSERAISFPVQMWKLKHLRHLNAKGLLIELKGRCSKLNEKMWNLQTIAPLILNMQAISLIEKGTFPNIKRMGFHMTDDYEGYEGKLINLLQNPQQLNHLNKLIIINVGNLLTSEVIFPPNITELVLIGMKCITHLGMNGLRNHSKLKILILNGYRLENSVDLNCVEGGFPHLEVLKMSDFSIQRWELGNGAMQRLQNVFINYCGLDTLPIELCSLKGLRKVQISGSLSDQMVHILQILETNGVQFTRNMEFNIDTELIDVY